MPSQCSRPPPTPQVKLCCRAIPAGMASSATRSRRRADHASRSASNQRDRERHFSIKVNFPFRTHMLAAAHPDEPAPSLHHIPRLKPAFARPHARAASRHCLHSLSMLTVHALRIVRRPMLYEFLEFHNTFWLCGCLLCELRMLVARFVVALAAVLRRKFIFVRMGCACSMH